MDRTQVSWSGGRAAVAIRQARPADLAALGDFFAGLSMSTRYLRFFAPVTPGPKMLRLLAGAAADVDAVVAVRGGVIIGHAMGADRVDPRGVRVTDVGVVVADAWQGRGIGAALTRALLTGARARGVTAVTMDVLGDNQQALGMITAHWPAASIGHETDCVTFRIGLGQTRSAARPARVAGG
jgi:ribosomal protein S18 acetylase RimI-like enzyme